MSHGNIINDISKKCARTAQNIGYVDPKNTLSLSLRSRLIVLKGSRQELQFDILVVDF